MILREGTLTEKLRADIVKDILSGRYSPGSAIPAEREMALATGTSRVTVRRAYSQLEKAGIITRTHGSGTRISNTFRGAGDEVGSIALITGIRDPFAVDFIEAAESSVTTGDSIFVLALTDSAHHDAEVALRLASGGVKNIIVWASSRNIDFSAFERLRVLGVNIVFFDRVIPGDFADFIGLDNGHAMRMILNHARRRSPSEYVFIDLDGLDVDSNRERREYFFEICSRKGYKHCSFSIPYGSADNTSLRGCCLEHFGTGAGAPKALVCVNDTVAMRIKAFAGANYVYSIDGREEAVSQGIVSYSQPISEMAGATVKSLTEQQRKGRRWRASQSRFRGGLRGI